MLGVGTAIALLVAGAFAAASARSDAWHDAERSSANLMLAMKRDLTRNLGIIDLSLRGVQEALAIPGIADASPAIRKAALFDRAATAEDLGAMLVVGADGAVHDVSRGDAAAMPNFASEEFFRVQVERDAGLFTSGITRGGVCGSEPCLVMSRRLSSSNGQFAGVAIATMNATYLRNLFSSMSIGPQGTISLVGADGRMVWRQPAADGQMGRYVANVAAFQTMLSRPSGEYVGRSGVDGVERLHTFARIGDTSLMLSVNLALDDIYAHWRYRAFVIGPVLLLMCAAIAILTLLFRGEMRRRTRAEAALARLADEDGLTGLGNRRALVRETSRLSEEAAASGGPLSLIMVDVDHFKRFNDLFGHIEGDGVLKRVAGAFRHGAGSSSFVARFGGEEFAVVGRYDEVRVAEMAELLRRSVEALAIPHPGSPFGRVTISLGVASCWPSHRGGSQGLMKDADEALYVAKREGRNMVRPNAFLRAVVGEQASSSALAAVS